MNWGEICHWINTSEKYKKDLVFLVIKILKHITNHFLLLERLPLQQPIPFKVNASLYCVKSVRIRSYCGPHFSRIFPYLDWMWVSLRIQSEYGKMRENTDQNNSKYGHFLRSVLATRKLSFYKMFYLTSLNY